eukprot:IDg21642t1
MDMDLLNGLLERFYSLISELKALGKNDKNFTLEIFKIRCTQEEQRHSQRDKLSLSKYETMALVANLSSPEETFVHRDSTRSTVRKAANAVTLNANLKPHPSTSGK